MTNEIIQIHTLFDVLNENHPNVKSDTDALLVILSRYYEIKGENRISDKEFGIAISRLLEVFYYRAKHGAL
jgi:hypothetical protein